MKFKLLEEKSSTLFLSGTLLLTLILVYLLFAACVLGIIFFVLWNIGIAPVLEIEKLDIVASCLATLSIFSIFNFVHIDILKDNKRRCQSFRYTRYNLWLNIGLKVFVYLFASIPFIILWNYAIPNIFSLNLVRINLIQTILFIISIRFISGMIFYSISKEFTSSRLANNMGEIFIDIFNDACPEGTFHVSNELIDEKAGDIDYIDQYCKNRDLVYRLGSISTEYVAILCPKKEKNNLNRINAVIFNEENENTDWFKFCDLDENDMKDLDIIEFQIYKCGIIKAN